MSFLSHFRFKWAYLKQQQEHEREVHRQRMNAEISQVRREADHYVRVSQASKKIKDENNENENKFIFKQKLTEEEILKKREQKKKKNEKFRNKLIAKKKLKKQEFRNKKVKPDDNDFLSSVFVGANK